MKNLFELNGKVAPVTGGSRGIGEMIATGLVSNSDKTYFSSRKADVCNETVARLSEHSECISIPAYLSSKAGSHLISVVLPVVCGLTGTL